MSIESELRALFGEQSEQGVKRATKIKNIYLNSTEEERLTIDRVFIALCGDTLLKLAEEDKNKD